MSIFGDVKNFFVGKSATEVTAEQLDNSVINRGKIGEQTNAQRKAIDQSNFEQAKIESIEASNQAARTNSELIKTQTIWNLQSNVDNSLTKDILSSNYNKPKADSQQTMIYMVGGVVALALIIGLAMVLKK